MIESSAMPDKQKFTLGLIQMRCGTDPSANMDKAVARIRDLIMGM